MFIIIVWIIHWANVLLKWVILLFISCWTLLLDSKLCKMIAIIKLHILLTITLPIFSVSLKFEAYYIMDQWQWVQSKECYFMFTFIFWAFVVVFHQKVCFYHFHSFFWWSIKFLNIDQSKTRIGEKKLSVELYFL